LVVENVIASRSFVTSTLALAVRLSTPCGGGVSARAGAARRGRARGRRAASGKVSGFIVDGLVKCGSNRGCNSTSMPAGTARKAAQNRDCYK
jgi:hypothetical protein